MRRTLGVTPVMSLIIFLVQPSSATISSFDSVVRDECAQVWTESLRKPACQSGASTRLLKEDDALVAEHVLSLHHLGARDGARADNEEGRLEVLLLEEVQETRSVGRRTVVCTRARVSMSCAENPDARGLRERTKRRAPVLLGRAVGDVRCARAARARKSPKSVPSSSTAENAREAVPTHQPPQVHQHRPSPPACASASALVAFEQPLRPVGPKSGMFSRSISLSHCFISGESSGGITSRAG